MSFIVKQETSSVTFVRNKSCGVKIAATLYDIDKKTSYKTH